jgi:cell division GTPase FtsZ
MQGIIKVAGVAKRMGILTVGVVTIPFYFEKKRKIIKALKCTSELITLPRELVVPERG